MRDLTVGILHEVIGGRLRMATLPPRAGEAAPLGRIVTDSRQVQPGDVFWGLAGPKFDGSAFADAAYGRGAAGVVVAGRYVQPWPGCWSIQVESGQQALVDLALWNRRRFTGSVVAVTGSVGKTTTNRMIQSVLSVNRTGSASPRNYNNHIGVPLSMLGMTPQDDFAVLELGASAPGEIAELAALCNPQIGVITNIGEAHLSGFGSTEATSKAKAELLDALPADGWAVLSGDDPWLRRLDLGSRGNLVWFGRSLDCDVAATDVLCEPGKLSFTVDGCRLQVPVWGRHYLISALAAVSVGKIFGYSMPDIAAGLAAFQAAPMRCQVTEAGGATIIDDTYNSSPAAMRAALELLRDFDAPGRRIVVCGDMRELGPASDDFHRRLGDEVVTLCGADMLVACGEHAPAVVEAARRAGMPRHRTVSCRAPEDALPYLDESISAGDVVLVKGSRVMAMERVVESLRVGHRQAA